MEIKFEGKTKSLRFRTQTPEGTNLAGANGKFKAGRWTRYNKTTKVELTAISADENAVASFGSIAPGAEHIRCWDSLQEGPPYRDGGPFALIRLFSPNFDVQGSGSWELGSYNGSTTIDQRYVGGFHSPLRIPSIEGNISQSMVAFRPGVFSAEFNPNDLASLGNAAYTRLRPKATMADLAQSIAEAKDVSGSLATTSKGFADLWKTVAKYPAGLGFSNASSKDKLDHLLKYSLSPKNGGDQFLNSAFGWAPFVRDVNDVCNVIVNGHDFIERQKAKNGVWQRRTFHEAEVRNETTVYENSSLIGCSPADNSTFRQKAVSSFMPYTITREEVTRVWYVGLFKAWYPDFDDELLREFNLERLAKVIQYTKILGIRADPVLVWKLTPYTWMADWFADVGSGIQRLQDAATDNVVSKYFYLMRERTFRYRYRCRFSTTGGSYDLSWYYGGESKMRASGESPFGFSLKPVNLSGFQLSILGSLGLSKWSKW